MIHDALIAYVDEATCRSGLDGRGDQCQTCLSHEVGWKPQLKFTRGRGSRQDLANMKKLKFAA